MTMKIRKIHQDSKSGFTGVYRMPKNHGKWTAQITVNYEQMHLGVFDTKEEAITARADADQRLGQFQYNSYKRRLI